MAKCLQCDRIFKPTPCSIGIFCSRACHLKNQKATAVKYSRTCPECKKVFTQRDPRKKYCSRACYVASGPGVEVVPLAERFWRHVHKTDNCWFWIGATKGKGKNHYGSIKPGGPKNNISAHRASWIIHFGDIPMGQQVCHSCDNPQCIRPDHLFLGTNSKNQQDSSAKGRKYIPDNRGEKHGLSKLKEADVIQIRNLKGSGLRVPAIAKLFNVSVSCIYSVLQGTRWGYV